jgi:hypothetical protein
MDELDLRSRAAECRAYAAACGHPGLAAVALDVAEAFEAEAALRAAEAQARAPRRPDRPN